MATIGVFLRLAHFLGLGLALGSATAKLLLLLKSRADPGFTATFLAVAGQLTRLILIGSGLLALSGIGWLLAGYPMSGMLVIKIVLVVIAMAVGGSMDKLLEPRFRELAPKSNGALSPEFARVQKQYLLAESVATGLYVIIVAVWVMR